MSFFQGSVTAQTAPTSPITGGKSVSAHKEVRDELSSIGSDRSSSESDYSDTTRAAATITDPVGSIKTSRLDGRRSPFRVIDLTKESINRHSDVFSQTRGPPELKVAPFSPVLSQTPSFQ